MVLLRSLLSLRPIIAHRNCLTSKHLHKFNGSWWCVAQRIFRREHGFCSHKHCPVIIHKKCSCTHNVMCSQVGTGIKRKFSSEATLASNTKLWRYLESLVNEYQELTEKLALPYELNEREITAINQKMAALDFLVSKVKEYKEGLKSLDDLKMLVADAGQSDRDMVKLAELEKHQYEAQLLYIEKEIHLHLLPPEKGDHTDIILEVTAGIGGQEAMLFTDEIFHMYANYAAMKGWGFEVIDSEATDMGGLRRASASISGQVVYKHLKYEAGVHRVQRVPRTEKAGRMHTSTMTVAVLPQPTEIDIVINPKDLRIDTFRSSGKGGQHVNTTDSAVRIVHLPTGIVAECQAGRSQIQNKATAMTVLRSRLYERELEQQMKDQKSQRKLQVGSAGRSEKIRTYNFNQDRITDHRIGKNLYSVDDFLSGGEQLEEIINLLQEESRRERLMEILEQFTKRTEQQKS